MRHFNTATQEKFDTKKFAEVNLKRYNVHHLISS